MSFSLGAIAATASAVKRATGTVTALADGNYQAALQGLGSWASGMSVASWRGLPFAVRESTIVKGRRVAEHVYPNRDAVWAEDMGRGVRRYSFRGFLVGDDVLSQSKSLQDAAEQEGAGVLVHPALGSITCACRGVTIRQEVAGRTVEVLFDFVETSPTLYPSLLDATQNLLQALGLGGLAAAAQEFVANVVTPLEYGADVALAMVHTVQGWANIANTLMGDASLIARSVSGLVGNNGRYSYAARTRVQDPSATVASLLAASTTARTSVAAAVATAGSLPSAATTSATAAAVAANVQAVSESLRVAAQSPADQIRLLAELASYSASAPDASAPIGAAIFSATDAAAALCRRSVLMSLCIACADYQPSSAQDALALRGTVTDLLDVEMIAAADAGDTSTWQAFRDTRAALVSDLTTRGASLPVQEEITTRDPLPALALAYRLYEDASRADDLIARADPIHPAFMPTSFEALAS